MELCSCFFVWCSLIILKNYLGVCWSLYFTFRCELFVFAVMQWFCIVNLNTSAFVYRIGVLSIFMFKRNSLDIKPTCFCVLSLEMLYSYLALWLLCTLLCFFNKILLLFLKKRKKPIKLCLIFVLEWSLINCEKITIQEFLVLSKTALTLASGRLQSVFLFLISGIEVMTVQARCNKFHF